MCVNYYTEFSVQLISHYFNAQIIADGILKISVGVLKMTTTYVICFILLTVLNIIFAMVLRKSQYMKLSITQGREKLNTLTFRNKEIENVKSLK